MSAKRNDNLYHPGNLLTVMRYVLLCPLLLFPMANAPGYSIEGGSLKPAVISAIPQDGFNLVISEQISPTYAITNITSPVHNWFAGTFTNLPLGKPVTLGLFLHDYIAQTEPADVSKWRGLVPIMTYADPTRYEAYEWFTKDFQGRWVSGDSLKTGETRYAGTGNIPQQQVISQQDAPQFLSPDGCFWSPWREVENTEVLTGVNVFRIIHTFTQPSATVAMRIPFTYTYQQAFIERLKTAHLPGVYIDKLGGTPERRRLQVIRLEDPTSTLPMVERPTILIVAREHATEPASSWMLHGALCMLLADGPDAARLRKDTTWLFIPIQDPDGSASAMFDRLTEKFIYPNDPDLPLEVLAYARYFTDYVSSGRTIDITVSLHNVEANECPNLFSPFLENRWQETTIAFNQALFDRVRHAGYAVSAPTANWGSGVLPARLYGWCAARFGSFNLCFEVNDRYPNRRLNLAELQQLGGYLAEQLGSWIASNEGQRHHAQLQDRRHAHHQAKTAYYATKQGNITRRTPYELLMLGF